MKPRLAVAAALSGVALVWLANSSLPRGHAQDSADSTAVAAKAKAVLRANCYRCHGENGSKEGGLDYVLDVAKLVEKKKVIPGQPDKSKLFTNVKDDDMPPADEKPRPSKEDAESLAAWIRAGAPAFPSAEQKRSEAFVSDREVAQAVLTHLRDTPAQDRPFMRYFSLANIANNAKTTDAELRTLRAALSKVINSLTWERDIVVPKEVDGPKGVLYTVDLRQLGWDKPRLWHRILTAYPYGLNFDRSRDSRLRETAKEIYQLSGSPVPVLRADWFVATATRPPLYHDMLRIPHNAVELETQLRVDVWRNFDRNQLARAGFTRSGVSKQNRLVERHRSAYGSYWKSYDFKTNAGAGNLFVNPLGPRSDKNPFEEGRFVHDGGEIIFSLPNGLQGYMLIDGKDCRIDSGPTEVVRDKTETSGSIAIVNGLSCMFCHAQGMIDFKDEIRAGHGLGGDLRLKVEDLYPPAADMAKLVKRDRDQFMRSLTEATGEYWKSDGSESSKSVELSEPVGPSARAYLLTEMDVDAAACELGMREPKALAEMVRVSPELREWGLGPLAEGGTIKRETWEDVSRLTSTFQNVAARLELGAPIRVR